MSDDLILEWTRIVISCQFGPKNWDLCSNSPNMIIIPDSRWQQRQHDILPSLSDIVSFQTSDWVFALMNESGQFRPITEHEFPPDRLPMSRREAGQLFQSRWCGNSEELIQSITIVSARKSREVCSLCRLISLSTRDGLALIRLLSGALSPEHGLTRISNHIAGVNEFLSWQIAIHSDTNAEMTKKWSAVNFEFKHHQIWTKYCHPVTNCDRHVEGE